MTLVYIATPYSHELAEVRESRYNQAIECCHHAMAQGWTPVSPIVMYHPVASMFKMHTDAETWWKHCASLLVNCKALVIYRLDGWDTSVGIS